MSRITLKERVAILETKIAQLIIDIKNHTGVHIIDRVFQAINLLGVIIVIFLLKLAIFK